jgi:hypothetical protein
MTALTEEFIRRVQAEPIDVEWAGKTLTLGPTTRHASGFETELVVREGDDVAGFITAYGPNEHGAMPARLVGVPPVIVRTLEDALREILR